MKIQSPSNVLIFDRDIQDRILGRYSPEILFPLEFQGQRIDVPRLVFSKSKDGKNRPLLDTWKPNLSKRLKIFIGVTGCGKTHR